MVSIRGRENSNTTSNDMSYVSLFVRWIILPLLVAQIIRPYEYDSVIKIEPEATIQPPKSEVEKAPKIPLPPLNLGKNVSRLVINIGSNRDPVMVRKMDGPCAMAIAFEPVVPDLISPHPQLIVVPAAVTGDDNPGLASMTYYNNRGVSSSLARAVDSYGGGFKGKQTGTVKLVPTVPMRHVLESLPTGVIDYLVTDMQGYDFAALSSAGDLLVKKQVKRIMTEVWYDDQVSYGELKNDFCRDWLPFMTKLGYVYEGVSTDLLGKVPFNSENAESLCKEMIEKNGQDRQFKKDRVKGRMKEMDVVWRLPTVDPHLPFKTAESIAVYDYPKNAYGKQDPREYLNFSAEEYATCQ